MNAYEILQKFETDKPITIDFFYQLIKDFQNNYFIAKDYYERVALHRNPREVKNEILSELYSYLQQVQSREEMRDIDLEKKAMGYVPTKVVDIWKSDRRIKSLYSSVNRYCELKGKSFTVVAVHIAEYRAMNKLVSKIRRSLYKSDSAKLTPEPIKIQESKKIRTKIPKENKVRSELQKEVNSICPFCDNDDVGHFQIHHIDNNPSNNQIINLLLACPNCHSKITKGDISTTEVINKKNELINKKPSSKRASEKVLNFNSKINNVVVGDNYIVKIIQPKKKAKQKYPPGCIGYDSMKANYVSYLISRYNEYKEYEVEKEKMSYGFMSSHLKQKFKIGPTRTINNLPIEKFEELIHYIQSRIGDTKLARIKGANYKNYSTFGEYINVSKC